MISTIATIYPKEGDPQKVMGNSGYIKRTVNEMSAQIGQILTINHKEKLRYDIQEMTEQEIYDIMCEIEGQYNLYIFHPN